MSDIELSYEDFQNQFTMVGLFGGGFLKPSRANSMFMEPHRADHVWTALRYKDRVYYMAGIRSAFNGEAECLGHFLTVEPFEFMWEVEVPPITRPYYQVIQSG